MGGGPAGSTVAGLLARHGRDVLLVDRAAFPRPKPCGECLNPGAVDLLDRMGLLGAVRSLDPTPLTGWELRTAAGRGADGDFPDGRTGLAVSRLRLDTALLDQARRRGVRVREGWRVTRVEPARGMHPGPRVRLRGPDGRVEELRPRLLLGADGLRSTVARSVGAVARAPRLRKLSLTAHLRVEAPRPRSRGRLVLGEHGTVGLAPLGGALFNATVVVDPDRSGGAIAGRAAAFHRERVETAVPGWAGRTELAGGPWATGPFDVPVHRPWAPGVLLLGDAAGYFDPLTGQGVYRALRSAALAAATAEDVLALDRRVEDGPGDRYGAALRRAFGPGRVLQRAIETVVSKSWLREPAFAVMARTPATVDALIARTGDLRPTGPPARPLPGTPSLATG